VKNSARDADASGKDFLSRMFNAFGHLVTHMQQADRNLFRLRA
jgi:hypothetical protein